MHNSASKAAERAKPRSGRSPGRAGAVLQTRWRVLRGGQIAFGPGKADLLVHLAETGSISEAARRMEMSYMRAWSLIKVMNRSFQMPLVAALRGGVSGGGAELTSTGRRVLRLYRRMEAAALRSSAADWRNLQSLLRP